MNKHIGPVLAVVAALGVVGGVSATQAFKPVEKAETPQVRLVQPAAETVTVTPSPTTTTTAPEPVKVVKPKVESKPKATTEQRQAIVSEQPTEPLADEPVTEPTPATSHSGPPPRQGGAGGNYVCSPTGCVTQAP